MNILLVYPDYPDTFWSFKHALKFVSKKASFPPLGLLTVASMLPKHWEKKLIDVNIQKLKDVDILWADMVFISAMLVQKDSAKEIIKRCKKLGRTVVAGGPAFTAKPESFRGVDHLVLNEAEVTLPLFLKDLEDDQLKTVYTSDIKPDITKTPVPMWSLINHKKYATMPIQYSRGCPYNCEFCDIVVMNGRTPRTKTTRQIIKEFQALYDTGYKGSVFIVDDNFIGHKASIKNMLPSLIRWQKKRKYPFAILTEASTNLADDTKLMQMMSSANFFKIFLGIETPSLKSLKECDKHQNTNRDLRESIKIIQQHGMQVMGGFIVGFDNDKDNIFERQIEFIQATGIVTAMVGMLTALPHTRLWHRLKAEGRLIGDSSGENTDGSLNFRPIMGRKKLMDGYNKMLKNIYSHKKYYRRINTFIKNYRPTVKSKIKWVEVKAFIRSTWRIGIFSGASPYYWKMIFKTFFTKIKAFPIAIELAIYGQHFRKIVKRSFKRKIHKAKSSNA